jgi:hypothetical protein
MLVDYMHDCGVAFSYFDCSSLYFLTTVIGLKVSNIRILSTKSMWNHQTAIICLLHVRITIYTGYELYKCTNNDYFCPLLNVLFVTCKYWVYYNINDEDKFHIFLSTCEITWHYKNSEVMWYINCLGIHVNNNYDWYTIYINLNSI